MSLALVHEENATEKNDIATNLWELLKKGETDGKARNHVNDIKESLEKRKK
ncbi:hypothetical protein ABR769_25665 [Bacillus cereus]|uniref:hypothetical protein n=1 Tax=Bacillus TaxID=1386 RepID=UPI0001A1253E|nr:MULTISPECIES: hypothetical protein [Bacillus]EEL73396.1 hypothetical protein bcere0027_53150 [Bacillus cereus AH676]HDR4450927.1 hypothetical protein [Bacillus cereus]